MALQPDHVFINCPFDAQYKPLFQGIVFAVHYSGFVARSALEVDNASENRLEKIMRIMSECRYGVHDISRTELDAHNHLPRFNMPFELGLFLGCKRFGGRTQGPKSCLILDEAPYRYQQFLSDIAGQDIAAHERDPDLAIRRVRDWLRTESRRANIPGAAHIVTRFHDFLEQLPTGCQQLQSDPEELTFADLVHLLTQWLQQ